MLLEGPVIANREEAVKRILSTNSCKESCPAKVGKRTFTDISVRWLGCGQAVNPRAVRFFGLFSHENILVVITMQTRWKVPAERLPGLVTDPAGPLRVAFQTVYSRSTYNETLPTPAPTRTLRRGSVEPCDR